MIVTPSSASEISADKYLDGLVAAISRVGVMITMLGVISGLIFVVWYVDNFSFDESQHAVATKVKEKYEEQVADRDFELRRMLDVHRIGPPTDESRQALDDVRFQRSILVYKIAVIDNELKKVSLGRVKLPILNHEVPTNDASVVLGFFLVIISLVTLITVKHINQALDDRRLLRVIRQEMLLLRSRLILIYAPIAGNTSAIWIWLIFFLPCLAALVTFGETLYYLGAPEHLDERRMWGAVYLRASMLGLMTLFLGYVGYALLRGWLKLRRALAE